jgi:hypothetical protein
MFECHDCFSITELVTMEDLQLSPEGGAIKDVMNGFYDSDGQIPCQIDGGLKCFGHPIGASGIRMLHEINLQLQARRGAPTRQSIDRDDAQPRRLADVERRGGLHHRRVRLTSTDVTTAAPLLDAADGLLSSAASYLRARFGSAAIDDAQVQVYDLALSRAELAAARH